MAGIVLCDIETVDRPRFTQGQVVGGGVLLNGGTGVLEIRIGGEEDRPTGQRHAPVPQSEQQRTGQTTACGIAGYEQAVRVETHGQEALIAGQGIVQGGRKGVFRREAIGRNEGPGPADPDKPGHEAAMGGGAATDVTASVQVENGRGSFFDCPTCDPLP